MTAGLRRFREPKAVLPVGARCEMCAEPIDDAHSHVVDIESRALLCACRSCYLLFTSKGAAHGKFRAVPERYLYAPRLALADEVWNTAGIPVSMAFAFVSSATGKAVAFYPSPAGATESMLEPEAWQALLTDNPAFADLEPDVEALLVNRGADGFEAFGVPIDVCYELVGVVRLYWKGFDGGTEAWTAINDLFASLRERGVLVGAGRG